MRCRERAPGEPSREVPRRLLVQQLTVPEGTASFSSVDSRPCFAVALQRCGAQWQIYTDCFGGTINGAKDREKDVLQKIG